MKRENIEEKLTKQFKCFLGNLEAFSNAEQKLKEKKKKNIHFNPLLFWV
jgi:hypothetical protein